MATAGSTLYLSDETELYPEPRPALSIPVRLARCTKGSLRRFLRGVAPVVSKLFHIVGPDFAVFGKKTISSFR